MKKVNFASFPRNSIASVTCRHKAGPDSIFKLNKQWSNNLRIKSRARRIIFSTGATTCKIERLKEVRIKFVLTRNF